MTFEFLSIFHDFPGNFIFPGFSMIFHDRGNPEYINIYDKMFCLSITPCFFTPLPLKLNHMEAIPPTMRTTVLNPCTCNHVCEQTSLC